MVGGIRHTPVLLVGHRLSSDRRTAVDWALAMLNTVCYR